MTYLHSGLNPLIYSFLSYGYRARLLKLWKRISKNEGAQMTLSDLKSEYNQKLNFL